jgi:hypothetical protein
MPSLRTVIPVVLLLSGISTAWAATALGPAGSWKVTWDNDQKNQNALTLKLTDGRLSGDYVNDAGDKCTASGNFAAETRKLSIAVICPNWNIWMRGMVSEDGRSVDGTYEAYVDGTGSFRMARD